MRRPRIPELVERMRAGETMSAIAVDWGLNPSTVRKYAVKAARRGLIAPRPKIERSRRTHTVEWLVPEDQRP